MSRPNDFVDALARAYTLSDLFDPGTAPVREALERASGVLGEPLDLRVDGGAVRVDGRRVSDGDGTLGELARDLELADVCRLRIPEDVEPGELEELISALRDGSGQGDGLRSADRLGRDLARIGVAFAGAGAGRSGPVRGISTLFEQRAGPAAPAGEEPAGAETAEAAVGGDATADEAPARLPGADLSPAVSRYLEADDGERHDARREVRLAAERARSEGAVDELAEAVERLALGDEAGEDRAAGARKLARQLLDPTVAARIVLRLGVSREGEWRQERIRAVSRLGPELAPALAEALVDAGDRTARRAYTDALVGLGDDARPEIEAMLDDDRWFVVRNGARILARFGDETDVGLLTSALAHDDPRVRRETVIALGRIGGEDAEMLLLGMLDDPDPEVRSAVAMALGALAPERAAKPLLERLENESDEEARIQVVRALGAIGDPGAVPALEKRAVGTFFSRPSSPLRVAAYRALAAIGTPHAMELLEEACEDRDETVRDTARSLLQGS